MQKKIFYDQLIVITGAAGFIGSGVVRHLNDLGYSNLLLVDDFGESEKWKNLHHKKYSEIVSRYELFDWLKGREREIEAFIHLGACSDTTETDGDYIMENNYRYSIKLAEYALQHEHRFIYASSAATYGDGSQGFVDDHEKLEELEPLNLYGYSKHAFDLWIKQHGALDQAVGLKYFNVFGPNEAHKGRMASMVYHMTKPAKEEGKVKLFKSSDPKNFGDGEQCRDFIYVKDAAAITCSFLDNSIGGIFNVGRGEAVAWNTVAKAIFKAIGKPGNIEYIDMPKDLLGKYQNFTQADLKKYKKAFAKEDLKPHSCQGIEEAVADYVQNYLLTGKKW
ncbi:MAG: ADP-glyceromanno-heptose 6-epimerase [Candidatus Algichlamydia australiensis]|nr:ADP-glyceromanno-heptose 6-epimerase [Chlamydiales bacterium]